MSLTNEQKLSFLTNIKDEVFLIEEVLVPMFNNMEKYKVIKTHGPNEKGKDIVLISKGDFGKNIYTGIIVKNEKITNASKNSKEQEIVATVKNQITMCLNSGYDSIEERENVTFDNIIVLTSKEISNSAREEFVKLAKSERFTNIHFWEAKEIIEKIDDYLPDIYLVSSGVLSKYFHILKEKCENLNELKKIQLYKGDSKKLSDIYIEPKVFKRKEQVKNGHTTAVYANTTVGKLLEKPGKYIITGSAGAGKSTLLRSEIFKMIVNFEVKKNDKIPIFIRIKDIIQYIKQDDCSESCIIEYLSFEYNLSSEDIPSILKDKEKLMFFFDGFDELSTDTERNLFFKLLETIEGYPQNTIVVTSRKIKLLVSSGFSQYSKWEVSDFTVRQITTFFQKWFKNKNEQLIADLKDHDLLDKLPNTPLVMTLIAILFESDENVEIPANLSELYKMFVELLLGRWNLDRKIDTFYKANDKETFLTDLALYLHTNNKISCSEDELFAVFDATGKRLGRSFNFDLLLDEIIKDTNLLIRNERQEYEFRHLSFQEYFVGVHLTIKNDIDEIIELFPNQWWDQVLYYYCGTRKENDDVLPRIYDKLSKCSNKEKILGIFEMGYLIQSSYKTDAKLRGELLLKSLIDYSQVFPEFLDEMEDDLKKAPEIIYYLSFMEAYKMHYHSKYLKEIYDSIYKDIRGHKFDTFEKALPLFLLTVMISANGNIDVLADCDEVFKEFPVILLMEDFLIRCELLSDITDKEQIAEIKEHSRKIGKRIKNNRPLYRKLLE